jgi:hypothetical protein
MRTEDNIRAAFQSLRGEAHDADSMLTTVLDRLRHAESGSPPVPTRRPLSRLLVPLAAGAAVIAVIAAATLIATKQHASPRGQASSQQLPRSSGVPPPYFMWIPAGRPYGSSGAVSDTATGRLLAVARPHRPYSFAYISTAADDRTFALAALPRLPPPCPPVSGQACRNHAPTQRPRLFIARFNPATRSIASHQLSTPAVPWPTGLALSPDGSEIAVAANSGLPTQDRQAEVWVYSLKSHTVKVWRDPGWVGESVYEFSWGPRGELAFTWTGDRSAPGGIWLLNTNAPGGTISGAGRLVVRASSPGRYFLHQSFALSGDGKIITAVAGTVPPDSKHVVFVFQQFSVATGRELRAIWPTRSSNGLAVWSNSSGSALVGFVPLVRDTTSAWGQLGVLRGARFARISWNTNTPQNAEPSF